MVWKQPSWYQAIWSSGPSHFWFALGFTCGCVRLVSSSPSVYLDQHLHVAACFHFCFCDSMRVSAFKELSIFLQMQSWRKKRNLHCKKSSCNYVNQVQSYLPLILSFNFEGISSSSRPLNVFVCVSPYLLHMTTKTNWPRNQALSFVWISLIISPWFDVAHKLELSMTCCFWFLFPLFFTCRHVNGRDQGCPPTPWL